MSLLPDDIIKLIFSMVPSVLQQMFEYAIQQNWVSLANRCVVLRQGTFFIDKLLDEMYLGKTNWSKVRWILKKCGRPTFNLLFHLKYSHEWITCFDSLHMLAESELKLIFALSLEDTFRYGFTVPPILDWFIKEKHFGVEHLPYKRFFIQEVLSQEKKKTNVSLLNWILEHKLDEIDKETKARLWVLFHRAGIHEDIDFMQWCYDHDCIPEISVDSIVKWKHNEKTMAWLESVSLPIVYKKRKKE